MNDDGRVSLPLTREEEEGEDEHHSHSHSHCSHDRRRSSSTTTGKKPWPLRSVGHYFFPIIALLVGVFGWNEYIVYYAKIGASCEWPDAGKGDERLRAFIIADTHLLGRLKGHWFDKLRREWQMHRGYQTAVQLLRPDAAFFLGDIFDEGQWADEATLEAYARRFEQLFGVPSKVRDRAEGEEKPRIIVLPGNHDLGFHYAMNPYTVEWFQKRFAQDVIDVVFIGKRPFILVTSMALHGDGCRLCAEAERTLQVMGRERRCVQSGNASSLDCRPLPDDRRQPKVREQKWPDGALQPVLLQHFPLHRVDERPCSDVPDGDPNKLLPYRSKWEALSEESTDLLLKQLQPVAAFDGHSHRLCTRRNGRCAPCNGWRRHHSLKKLAWTRSDVTLRPFTEYTVNSFSWRNGRKPSLLLVSLSKEDDAEEPLVSRCDLPNEDLVVCVYCMSMVLLLGYLGATGWAAIDWGDRERKTR